MDAPSRGRFIVFEGIDGAGKSSVIQAVAAALAEEGGRPEVVVTREETDTWLGEAVRRGVAEGMDPLATTLLFVADRAQHAPRIRGDLDAGRHVLCDRFSPSTYAYQGVTLEGRVPDVERFLDALHAPIDLTPDHVVLLDVDPAVGVARVAGRGAPTRYEKEAFLGKVRKRYLALARADPDRYTVIDADGDRDEVAAATVAAVQGLL